MTRRRDASDHRRISRLAIRGNPKRQRSDRDASDRSDDSDDDVQGLREKLEQAEAKKTRKKSVGRREDRAIREELLTRSAGRPKTPRVPWSGQRASDIPNVEPTL